MTALTLFALHHVRTALLLGATGAVVRALWQGARREVVRFGEDIAVVIFARLRRLLRMKP